MILNDRKIKLLEAIITDYIQTAEPIGSRTIAKKYDFGLSSATIRNEMSDLEDMGLITQPHASSGRVPSDKGYRLYVDRLMQHRELDVHEKDFLQQLVLKNINRLDYLCRETAKAIALLTNCITIASEPTAKRTKIKCLQLMPLDERTVVLVLITDSKLVKNAKVSLKVAPEADELFRLGNYLNSLLEGLSVEEIPDKVKNLIEDDVASGVCVPIIETLLSMLQTEDNIQVYTTGVKNILEFPEFNDIDKAKELINTLEEKDMLIKLLGDDSAGDVQIVIGSENSVKTLKDCSVVKTTYRIGDNTYGNIGIIGPTRMNYAQAVSILNDVVNNINYILSNMEPKSLPLGGADNEEKDKRGSP